MKGPNDDRRSAVFAACTRHLQGHGPRRMHAELLALAATVGVGEEADTYGRGKLIEEFEADIAQLLGKAEAVFMPSGTMAQQIALRIHAERAGCATLAFHPTCHLELHEQYGYRALHHLTARLVGQPDRPLGRDDLMQIAEPIGALLLELPQRELGGVVPSWEDLVAQASWARTRGIALHLDGARLWEAASHYTRSLSEISSLFDTVYVSFYKTLGAIAGAVLAGPNDVIAEARVWQRRHGGNLVTLFPYVLSARAALATRLGRIEAYRERAVRFASLLSSFPGVRVTPDPPQTNMMHVTLPLSAEQALEASVKVAERHGVVLFTRTRGGASEHSCTVELTIGDASAEIEDKELEQLLAELLRV